MGNKGFSFDAFVKANTGRDTSGFDYLCLVYKSENLGADFLKWTTELFLPTFKRVEGSIFVSELYDAKRHQECLAEGQSIGKIQFWMNLLEITGMFDDLDTDQAMALAESLALAWNMKLAKEFGPDHPPARAILDEDTQEVFITIDVPNWRQLESSVAS